MSGSDGTSKKNDLGERPKVIWVEVEATESLAESNKEFSLTETTDPSRQISVLKSDKSQSLDELLKQSQHAEEVMTSISRAVGRLVALATGCVGVFGIFYVMYLWHDNFRVADVVSTTGFSVRTVNGLDHWDFGSSNSDEFHHYVMTTVEQNLPVLISFTFLCLLLALLISVALYHLRPREIRCSDRDLLLQADGGMTIALRWSAIKSIEQSRIVDIFKRQKDILKIETETGYKFHIRVADILRRQEIGTFFDRVRTNAPHAVLKVDDAVRGADPAYTELWLKYFSAPSEREKTGLLESKMLVGSGRYSIVSTIGGGGQGTAYLAEVLHPETLPALAGMASSFIVLKEYILPIHRGKLTAEKTAVKLKSEAAILRRLHHEQIVKLLDDFIEDYRGYLVLEYVDGETLKSLVQRLGPQPEAQVIAWALQICDILIYLHGQEPPVVHRDLTPDNIILQSDGRLKIVDFNVAHQVDSSATATVVGKHAYIPPEQFRGKPVGQSDIYAVGCTLHYLLTAQEPEPITASHPKEVVPSLSKEIDRIVHTATSLDLQKRYADAFAFKEALLQQE